MHSKLHSHFSSLKFHSLFYSLKMSFTFLFTQHFIHILIHSKLPSHFYSLKTSFTFIHSKLYSHYYSLKTSFTFLFTQSFIHTFIHSKLIHQKNIPHLPLSPHHSRHSDFQNSASASVILPLFTPYSSLFIVIHLPKSCSFLPT